MTKPPMTLREWTDLRNAWLASGRFGGDNLPPLPWPPPQPDKSSARRIQPRPKGAKKP